MQSKLECINLTLNKEKVERKEKKGKKSLLVICVYIITGKWATRTCNYRHIGDPYSANVN